MYHLDNTSGVPEMPEPKEQQSITPRWFGESQEQGGISWPGADWFNVVQAELLNLLAAAGIEPDKHSYDQLSKAIPVLGDAKIRAQLISEKRGEGAFMLAYTPELSGGATRTQHEKNAEFVSVTDFSGAVSGRENDSTAAFVAAYATGLPVYVPYGEWFTHTFDRLLTYGPGRVFSDDKMFTDSGERIIPPHPNNNRSSTTYHETRGNFERAAGRARIINAPGERVQVSGFSNPAQYASYANNDHVGDCVQMHAPRNFVSTAAASTTYTAFSMTAPEIFSGANIQLGDFINTAHPTRYKGKVLEINFQTHTITVDGWYAAGDSSAGQVPENGYSANINKADKIWGRYDVIYIDQYGMTATGHEIGFSVSQQPGNPVWGLHVANYGIVYSLPQAYRVTGKWLTGLFLSDNVRDGVQKNVSSLSPGVALLVSDLVDNGWTGSAIQLDTNFRKLTSYLARITTGGVTQFAITSQGSRSVQRESYGVVSTGTTITGLSASEISCTNANDVTITLNLSTTSFVAGQVFYIRATGGPVVVGGYTLNDANGRYIKFLFDGTAFIKRFQTN